MTLPSPPLVTAAASSRRYFSMGPGRSPGILSSDASSAYLMREAAMDDILARRGRADQARRRDGQRITPGEAFQEGLCATRDRSSKRSYWRSHERSAMGADFGDFACLYASCAIFLYTDLRQKGGFLISHADERRMLLSIFPLASPTARTSRPRESGAASVIGRAPGMKS